MPFQHLCPTETFGGLSPPQIRLGEGVLSSLGSPVCAGWEVEDHVRAGPASAVPGGLERVERARARSEAQEHGTESPLGALKPSQQSLNSLPTWISVSP